MEFTLYSDPQFPILYKAPRKTMNKVMIHMPFSLGADEAYAILRGVIGSGHIATEETHPTVFYIASGKLQQVAEGMCDLYGQAEVQIKAGSTQICTGSCQGAKKTGVDECECICAGVGHGNGWPDGWKLVKAEGDMLVMQADRVDTYELRKESKKALWWADKSTWVPLADDDPMVLQLDLEEDR